MWYQELFYRLAIFGIKDVIEILCITNAIYFFSVWLKQDLQKPLVLYFYSMCSLVVFAHLANLTTITSTLSMLYPAIIMLFILIHQKSLQHNFVTLKNIQPAHIANHNWLETLLRSCIIAANNKQQIICLIENQDVLSDLVTSTLIIKAKLQPELLDALLTSTNYNPAKMIWLSNTGTLIGLNTDWMSIHTTQKLDDDWQTASLLITKQTDALTFRLNPHNKSFDIICDGQLLEKISMDHAIKLMQRHFIRKNNNPELNKNGKTNDHKIQKKSSEQLHT